MAGMKDVEGYGHKHKIGERCDICSGKMSVDDVKRWEEEKLEKCGFYVHGVVSREEGYINAHTHGFERTWSHRDFQIVLRLPDKVVMDVFWNFARKVKAGEVFCDGMKVEEIVRGYPVLLSSAFECRRPVLRVLFPDAKGRFPGDPDVEAAFEHQNCVEQEEPPADLN